MKTGPLYLLILLLLSVNGFSQQKESGVILHVSPADFKTLMDSLDDEVIVDLRTPEELKLGRISGANTIDFFGAVFESSIQPLDRNKVYLLYCAAGGRSGETAELMEKMGFKTIYNLEKGFNGWVKERMPVITR